jgi:hypothetical protein
MSREELERLNETQLMKQYQTLVDFIEKRTGLPFEREPKLNPQQLRDWVLRGQQIYFETIVEADIEKEMSRWAEDNPNRVVLVA